MGSIFLGSFPFYGQTAFNHAIPFLEDCSDAACRVVIKMRQRTPFLPIGEICCSALGRGGAVGASRELPAHPRVLLAGSPAFVATWRAASRLLMPHCDANHAASFMRFLLRSCVGFWGGQVRGDFGVLFAAVFGLLPKNITFAP